MRELAQRILEDERYRAQLQQAAITGKLPPVIEVMLWAYAYGKPRARVELNVVDGYSGRTDDELRHALADRLGSLDGAWSPCATCPRRDKP